MRRVFRYLLLPLAMILMLGADALAQGSGKYKNFPVPFGPTNAGREFWLAFPANWDSPSAAQYYIRLYITSGVRTQVRVWAGAGIKKVFYTKPYDIVTVDLTPIEAQMFTRNDVAPVPDDKIYKGRAVHIEAEAPIVVYGMNRTSFTSDGLLALPVNALGRQYIVASYAAVIGGIQELPSQYMITAPYNNTTVTIDHPATGETPNHMAGERITINLDSGDVWSAMTMGYGGDMSGAVINASKPVAVTSGQACTYIPNQINFCCCDHLTEMMLPVESWGKFYEGVPFQTRLKGDFWRIFAGDDNATIYINGNKYATLGRAGGEEGTGWLEYRALGKELVEIHSDKRIYVSQLNPSQAYDGVPSDPFFLVLTPQEQFQTALTFCTPSADFPLNFVNLIADSATWRQIEIANGGTNAWEPLWKYAGVGVPRMFPTKIKGRTYLGVIIELRPGVYRMRSPMPFAGYIYGFSAYDSYGYPLSVAVGDLSTGDTIAPVITLKQTCDGTVTGSTYDLPDDAKVRTNLATVELDPENSYNYDLIVDRFEAGVSPSTRFALRVTDPTKAARAIIVISDKAGNASYDSVFYRPFTVAIEPTLVDLGEMNVGESRRAKLTIRNLGTTIVDVLEVMLKLKDQGFTLISPIGGFPLGPAGSAAESYEAEVEFVATKEGTFSDSLGIRDTCGQRYIVLLKAEVGEPVIKVSDVIFDPQLVGTTAAAKLMEVENAGTGTLRVTAGTGPTDGNIFKLPGGLPGMAFELKAKQRVQFQITFTPDQVKTFNDAIVFTHNAGNKPANDSIGLIVGPGIEPSLIATSEQWPRTRVGRNGVPKQVWLKNFGTAPVRVDGLSYSGDQADFTLNESQVRGVTIAANDSVPVDVGFRPTATGDRKVTVTYDANPPQKNPVVSTLEGIGVIPMLATQDYNFGVMNLGDPEVSQTAEFWIPLSASQYLDTVTITGFQWRSDQFGGTEDFRRLPLDQPVTLIPGVNDRVSFTGFFQARAAGQRLAELKAITNDGVDTTSHWTGRGIALTSAIDGTGGSVAGLCVGDSGVIMATVTNNGALPLDIDSLRLDNPAFEIISPDPNTKITLNPTETIQITIVYRSSTAGTQNATLTVNNTTTTPRLTLPLSGTARSEVINSSLRLIGTKGANVELGKDMVGEISLDPLPPGMSISGYRVTLAYDTAQLWARNIDAEIILGSINTTGAVATINRALTRKGLVVIDVTLSTPIVQGGTLISVPFGVMFTTDVQRALAVTVEVPNGNCLSVNGSNGTIGVEPICGLNLRLIELTGNVTYELDQNKPNPFNPVTKIRYSLGLDGPTQMYLYDASGKVVQKLVDEVQKPGVYELTLDVTNLPTGNYYYKLVSGVWSETKMLTVVK